MKIKSKRASKMYTQWAEHQRSWVSSWDHFRHPPQAQHACPPPWHPPRGVTQAKRWRSLSATWLEWYLLEQRCWIGRRSSRLWTERRASVIARGGMTWRLLWWLWPTLLKCGWEWDQEMCEVRKNETGFNMGFKTHRPPP